MNLFQEDLLPRWLVLAAGWVAAVVLGGGALEASDAPRLGLRRRGARRS